MAWGLLDAASDRSREVRVMSTGFEMGMNVEFYTGRRWCSGYVVHASFCVLVIRSKEHGKHDLFYFEPDRHGVLHRSHWCAS